jgi:L-rhamnose-H+ transport protein
VSAAGADLPAIHAKHSLWTGLPILIVVLLGGFTTNFIWCVLLNLKNKTGYQYFTSKPGKNSPSADPAAGGESGPAHTSAAFDGRTDPTPVPLIGNYLFAGLAGVTWYFQFFFYSMGETQMGDYKFSSWTLHMASIIIFSSIWGLALREWKGASAKSKGLLFAGLGILILSTLVVGYGNYIGATSAGH